jgi:hypothetical protein
MVGVVVWLGPAFAKLLVVVSCWVLFPWWGCCSRWVVVVVGVPARILRTA